MKRPPYNQSRLFKAKLSDVNGIPVVYSAGITLGFPTEVTAASFHLPTGILVFWYKVPHRYSYEGINAIHHIARACTSTGKTRAECSVSRGFVRLLCSLRTCPS